MLSKILLGSGMFLFIASLLGIAYGIFASFDAMRDAELVGISKVQAGIEFALISSILGVGGFVISIIGVIKLITDRKKLG